jgi:hypothetical protein
VSYLEAVSWDLRVLHCNDPNCVGGDESVTTVDSGDDVGMHSSLVLDAAGNPVVAYLDLTNKDLKILHCNDPDCTGGDESITSPDTTGATGHSPELLLDNAGNPVVAYLNFAGLGLALLHCNDPNCAGGDESLEGLDVAVGTYGVSLRLDSAGYPVIAYQFVSTSDLRVIHCNDADCSGGDESITTPVTAGQVGYWASMALDSNGYPVVSYFDDDEADLQLLRCNDANCAGGDETVVKPDTQGYVGIGGVLQLDSNDNAVVAYSGYDENASILVVRCSTSSCATDLDNDGCSDAQENNTAPGSEEMGGRRSAKNPYDFYDVNGDGTVDLFIDIFSVAAAFGDDSDSDSGTGNPEPDGYDPALDRSPPLMGDFTWEMQGPDGLIDLFTDIFGVAMQFGHTCSAA